MTLENTRAAGLRQAAEYLREAHAHYMAEAAAVMAPRNQLMFTSQATAVNSAAIRIDRLAQEAESDE